MEDVDAPSRLPLLNSPYCRDILGEYGAFFAIANRIDRIHKNAWIGFQSWRATARKVCGCSSYCFIQGFVPLTALKYLFFKKNSVSSLQAKMISKNLNTNEPDRSFLLIYKI